ncbi:uncharacterized protein LOC122659522 [Telopea speciosissima]|uniref:uncharacterized protein LOC122659522 n=1 Tax=Telopea speciosissima TaxID=54955 RepID=UPI001CC499CE|nr:uncharacterized protein LOC122659522 [Telopea speciosissima]
MESVDAFNSCIEDIGSCDLRWSGPKYTWNNKRSGTARIACKLDRILVNEAWLSTFPSSHATFDNPGISNHCPISLFIQPYISFGPKPFKYFYRWSSHPSFLPTVKEAWKKQVQAFSSPLTAIARKLKNVQCSLKDWNSLHFGNISQHVIDCGDKLSSIQSRLQSDHLNISLVEEEKETASELTILLSQEESFARQKARIKWLDLGDSNTTYFNRSMKSKTNISSIQQLTNSEGTLVHRVKDIKDLAANYFKSIFNDPSRMAGSFPDHLLNKFIPSEYISSLHVFPTDEEIVAAIRSLKTNTAPGPDGFSLGFFFAAWDIVKEDLKLSKAFFSMLVKLKE